MCPVLNRRLDAVRLLSIVLCALLLLHSCKGPEAELAQDPALDLSVLISIEDTATGNVDIMATLDRLPPIDLSLHLEMKSVPALSSTGAPLLKGEISAVDGTGLGRSIIRTGPFTWTLHTEGRRRIDLFYTVILGNGARLGDGGPVVPYLDRDHAYLSGASLFVVPVSATFNQLWVSFNTPLGWEVITPWKTVSPDTFSVPGPTSLLRDPFALGNWKTVSFQAGGILFTSAFAPGQKDLAEVIPPLIKKLTEVQVPVFPEPPEKELLYLFPRPVAPGIEVLPGLESITFSVRTDPVNDPSNRTLVPVLAREFHRLWAAGRYDCPATLRFLDRGFSAFYAIRAMARSEIITWDAYADIIGEAMSACALNPRRGKLSLVLAGVGLAAHDPPAQQLVEQGGLLLAALLDAMIRDRFSGRNLDDFMRAFNNDPRWSASIQAPSVEDLLAMIEVFLGPAQKQRFRGLISEPFHLDAKEAFTEVGLKVKCTTQKISADLQGELEGTTLIALDPDAFAYQLGIRVGDRFIQLNGIKPVYREDVFRAWNRPISGRILATLERDGVNFSVDEPLPEKPVFHLDPDFWRE